MTFTKKSANLTPIADAVFTVVGKAREDKRINGEENVIDATIGTLCDNDGNLVALKSVFDHYDEIDHRIKASYAASFDGNPNFRKDVYEWVTQGTNLKLAHNVVATPGGSGAVSSTFTSVLDEGETVIIPNIAWGSYRLMATENNLKIAEYELFNDENHFNIDSIKE
ncbi:MAG: aminotransferase class I/II-fold pyridoxal phosphate-dependent enzyme, partial [Solobacterium sp.]|nr:aminotransferase class I/II-fold pyridoxal phosphate-dependent enzyme [Solobacterium sp.]